MRLCLLVLLSAYWLQAQPAVSEITFEMPVAGVYPHGQPIAYTGKFEGFTAGGGLFQCGFATGPEANTIWLRLTDGIIQPKAALGVGTHTGCQGAKIRLSGKDYPIVVKLRVVPAAAVTTTNNAGVADKDLPHCNAAFENKPRFNIRGSCQEANRRPGGNFNMPPVGGTYTDSFGTKIRVLAMNDATYYPGISPFNADESLVTLHGGIYRVSDGVKMYTYKPDNINSAQCWFELVPGFQNTMSCFDSNIPAYGGQGRIMRYTLPGNCKKPPCQIDSGTELYRVKSPYNFLSKGGSSGATMDGWAVWYESNLPEASYKKAGDWRLCAAKLTVSPGKVQPICIDNLEAQIGLKSSDYVNLSKAPDADGRRFLIAMSDAPMAAVFSFKPGDTAMTWHGFGPVRSDYPANQRLRPKCEVGVEKSDHCVQTPHADLVNSDGNAYLVGDGTPQIPYGAWITSFRFSAGANGPNDSKDWMKAEELGGGLQFASHQGGYVGCSALTAMCATTNYGTRAPRKDIAAGSVCDGTNCTLQLTDAHGWAVGQSVLVGGNNLGIPPGTTVTISAIDNPKSIRFASSVTGQGDKGHLAPNQLLDTLDSDEINVIRKFGANGVQVHRLADLRSVIYFGYDDLPKPAISPSGRYVVWGANNGIPGVGYVLLAEVGLGSPRASDQFTGPNDGVKTKVTADQVEFSLTPPEGAKACAVRISPQRDLAGQQAQTLPVAGGTVTAGGLKPSTKYWWRAQCGVNLAAGVVETTAKP